MFADYPPIHAKQYKIEVVIGVYGLSYQRFTLKSGMTIEPPGTHVASVTI